MSGTHAVPRDIITVLHSHGPLLAKRITPSGILAYDDARLFDVYPRSVASLDDVLALLQRLIVSPRCCAIRGELIDPANRRGVRRLLYPDGDEPATFRDVPRRWLALDVENIERPATIRVTDLAACGRLAIQLLPDAFQRARCIVQASAGHGIKPDIRLRLWFWLSRPAMGGELGRWLAAALLAPVDPASLRAVQPIFTAAPLFEDGATDPLPYRLYSLTGTDAVDVPSVADLAPPPRPPPSPPPSGRPGNPGRAIGAVLHKLAGAPQGERNGLLFWAACRFAEHRIGQAATEARLIPLAIAIGLTDPEARQTIRSAMRRGTA
jgi:hypothetical protein